MIINNEDGSVNIRFGFGDIGLLGYDCVDEDGNINGFVGMCNQDAQEIGSSTTTTNMELKDFPILMTFRKEESINVLIKALINAKSAMIESKLKV